MPLRWMMLAACVTVTAHAQPPAPLPPEEPVLAGPRVESRRPTSIVQRDFDGHVKVPEPSPEVAALALLDLDEATRARVDEVLGRRQRILTAFVRDNLLLLQQLDTAGKAGDKAGALALGFKAVQELRPLTEHGTLQEQIAGVLAGDQAREFDRALRDFWRELVADRVRTPRPDGKRPGRIEVLAQAKLESLGKEIERSLQAMITSGDLLYAIFLKGITLSPEQDEKVRGIFALYYEQTKGDANDKQNGQLFMSVLTCLNPDQQRVFIQNTKAFTGANRKPQPKAKKG